MFHGAIAGKKDPEACPSQLLVQGMIRTEVPVCISCPTGKAHKEARQADRKQHKNYADKDREEKDMPDVSDKEKKDTPKDCDKEEKDGH